MNLTQEDWVLQLKEDPNAVLLDVRTNDEFNEGSIPNAVNIDINSGQQFIDAVEALDPQKNYFVYCRSGMRSAKACEIMNQIGFENTYNLTGGIMQYEGEITVP